MMFRPWLALTERNFFKLIGVDLATILTKLASCVNFGFKRVFFMFSKALR
jgi:hypothetical protein